MQRCLLFLLTIITLFSCGGDNPVAIGPEEQKPPVDKKDFVALLVSGAKYWRFEEFEVEWPDSTRRFNLLNLDSTGTIPDVVTTTVARHTACTFDMRGTLLPQVVDSGPYGNIPYTPYARFGIFIPGYSYPGSWYWDEERNTVAVKGLSGPNLMISGFSKTKTSPPIGYLDNQTAPKYRTLNQAVQGASPDRIRVIYYEEDREIGTIKYIVTMRAAWVTKIVEVRARTESYEVLY